MSSRQPATATGAGAEDFYFNQNPPPKDLERHVILTREFVARHQESGRRVVLVTSGGTTVPLEKQTVRFSTSPQGRTPYRHVHMRLWAQPRSGRGSTGGGQQLIVLDLHAHGGRDTNKHHKSTTSVLARGAPPRPSTFSRPVTPPSSCTGSSVCCPSRGTTRMPRTASWISSPRGRTPRAAKRW